MNADSFIIGVLWNFKFDIHSAKSIFGPGDVHCSIYSDQSDFKPVIVISLLRLLWLHIMYQDVIYQSTSCLLLTAHSLLNRLTEMMAVHYQGASAVHTYTSTNGSCGQSASGHSEAGKLPFAWTSWWRFEMPCHCHPWSRPRLQLYWTK